MPVVEGQLRSQSSRSVPLQLCKEVELRLEFGGLKGVGVRRIVWPQLMVEKIKFLKWRHGILCFSSCECVMAEWTAGSHKAYIVGLVCGTAKLAEIGRTRCCSV